MSIHAISPSNQPPMKMPAAMTCASKRQETKTPKDNAEISKLNTEIRQTKAEIKETLKEVQKATDESVSGSSEKAQMLQSKMLMQQQTVMTKQMQLKEIEAPEKSSPEQASAPVTRPVFDLYYSEKDTPKVPDNIYRLEAKDDSLQIIFNRPEE